MTNRVFIVIPSFNEAQAVRQTIMSLRGQYEVVLVDDCSTDNTYDAIKDLPVHYLRHDINLGQGAALQTGMDYAYRIGADVVVHFDADGQHNADDIPRFIEQLYALKADIVLGSRFLRNNDVEAIPAARQLLLRVARIVNGLLTGLWLSDAHNGFRVLNRTALSAIRLRENRMAHATEILMQIRRTKLRYTELPTHIIYTDYSQAKGQRWQGAFNILFDVFVNKYFR